MFVFIVSIVFRRDMMIPKESRGEGGRKRKERDSEKKEVHDVDNAPLRAQGREGEEGMGERRTQGGVGMGTRGRSCLTNGREASNNTQQKEDKKTKQMKVKMKNVSTRRKRQSKVPRNDRFQTSKPKNA